MRGWQQEAAAIREAVAALPRKRGRGNPYPDELRQRVVNYYRARREDGATVQSIALDVGIIWQTIDRWVSTGGPKQAGQSAGFERLEIVEGPASAPKKQFVVRGPGGLCIEGLDIDSLAALLRRLS